MRQYELGLVLHPEVEQSDVTGAVDKVGQFIAADGGEVTSVDVWGRRALAYPIRKQTEGTYVFLQAQLDPARTSSCRRSLTLGLSWSWSGTSSLTRKSFAISFSARISSGSVGNLYAGIYGV
jgi:small subunit ribosomal protein S6